MILKVNDNPILQVEVVIVTENHEVLAQLLEKEGYVGGIL
jgi:hypothetical protein